MNDYNRTAKHLQKRNAGFVKASLFWVTALYLTIMVVLASSTFAEEITGASPKKDPNELAERINGKVDKLHGRLEELLDSAIASDDVFDPNRIESFKKEKRRAKKAKDRFHKEGGFKQVGRKNEFKNKKKWEKDTYDPVAFEDFEATLDNLDEVVTDADAELANAKHAKQMYMVVMASGEPDRCQDLVDFTVGYKIASSVVRGATIVAETTYNVTDAWANQDSFGWNASSISSVVAVIAGGLDLVATGLEIADEWQSSDIEAACLNQIDGGIAEIEEITAGSAEDVNDLVEAVKILNAAVILLNTNISNMNDLLVRRFDEQDKMLEEKFQALEVLLCTPHGQRPEFPKK